MEFKKTIYKKFSVLFLLGLLLVSCIAYALPTERAKPILGFEARVERLAEREITTPKTPFSTLFFVGGKLAATIEALTLGYGKEVAAEYGRAAKETKGKFLFPSYIGLRPMVK